jgi:hypothetical protein
MTLVTWSFKSWYERRIAVNTAIPDAASGSQRSSQTRRDASTTSKGAARKAARREYGVGRSLSGLRGERATDDPIRFERVDF